MKWVLDTTCNQSRHWVLDGHDRQARLRYNKEARSIRLHAGDQRLFFMERTGLLQQRIVLRTEYSVVIGESQFHSDHSGIIILDGEKFSFSARHGAVRLVDRQGKLVAESHIDPTENLDAYELSALLFGLQKATAQPALA